MPSARESLKGTPSLYDVGPPFDEGRDQLQRSISIGGSRREEEYQSGTSLCLYLPEFFDDPVQ